MLSEDADYLCPSVSRSALLCPENHIKRGTKRGTKENPNIGCRTIETKRSRMKTTNKHKDKSAIPMASMKALTGLRFVMRVSQLATK